MFEKFKDGLLILLLVGLCIGASSQSEKLNLGLVEIKGYVAITNANRVEEIDPIDQKYITETLADVANGTDATYYYYVDMNGFRKAGFQLEMDCDAVTVTATLEGSLQDDGTAPASVSYIDITNDTFGVASLVSAAAPISDMWIDNAEKLACFKFIRIKIVAATGGDTGDWTIYHKKLY